MFYKLQLIVDVAFCEDPAQFNSLPELINAGITSIQLREKTACLEKIEVCAKKLVALLHPLNIPLIINDYVELVEKTGADGAHIGQQDMPYPEARKQLGPKKIIGLSIENIAQAHGATQFVDIDYFGVGPVFETSSKKDAAVAIGLAGLADIATILHPKPIIAIGGIQSGHLKDLLNRGAHGAAVISAILKAPDPINATATFLRQE